MSTRNPSRALIHVGLSLISAAVCVVCQPAHADASNNALPLPPMHLPFAFAQQWRVGGPGSYFGEDKHRNRNPQAPFNAWNDYYATDWNFIQGNNQDQPVYPVADGVVVYSDCDYSIGYGCSTVLEHSAGDDSQRYRTRYAHMREASRKQFSVGDLVKHWQLIGWVSNTGNDPTMPAHLHLSALSLDRSNGLQFYSNCAQGLQSGVCDNGEAFLAPQSRRIARLYTRNSNGLLQAQEISDGAVLESAQRPTLYFAGLQRSSDGRSVTVYVSNAHVNPNNPSETNSVLLQWYDRWGGLAYTETVVLQAHERKEFTAPSNQIYSLVVSAESGKEISAMAESRKDYYNSQNQFHKAYAGLESLSQGHASQIIPIWRRSHNGWDSTMRFFNPTADAIKLEVIFSIAGAPGVDCRNTIPLNGMYTATLKTSEVPCLTAGSYGSARVNAYYVDPLSGQNIGPALALASYEHLYLDAATGEMALMASSATPAGLLDGQAGKPMYAPLVYNNPLGGWQSGLAADKLEGSGSLQTQYYRATGGMPCAAQGNGGQWPIMREPLFPGSSFCMDSRLSAVLLRQDESANPLRYLAAQISQQSGMQASAYPALAQGGRRILIPTLKNDINAGQPAQISTIYLQNTSSQGSAEVSIVYYDANRVATAVQTEIIPANGSLMLPTAGKPFPSNVRNAEIISTRALAAVVNIEQISPACKDCTLSYVPELRN